MRDTCEGSSELDGPARPFSAQPEKHQRSMVMIVVRMMMIDNFLSWM